MATISFTRPFYSSSASGQALPAGALTGVLNGVQVWQVPVDRHSTSRQTHERLPGWLPLLRARQPEELPLLSAELPKPDWMGRNREGGKVMGARYWRTLKLAGFAFRASCQVVCQTKR